MVNTFFVTVTTKVLPLDTVVREYGLTGDLRGTGLIPRAVVLDVPRDAKVFMFAGYRFVVIGVDYSRDCFVVMLHSPIAYIVRATTVMRWKLAEIKYRVLLTAYVWGLREKPGGNSWE